MAREVVVTMRRRRLMMTRSERCTVAAAEVCISICSCLQPGKINSRAASIVRGFSSHTAQHKYAQAVRDSA